MYYTYSIKNIDNGKFYIGSRTKKCMLKRKPEDDLGVKYFSSTTDKELKQAIKDGRVEYHVLQEYDDPQVCWKAEQQLIALYWKFFGKDMSYNHNCTLCNGEKVWNTAGFHHSEETREKIGAIHKGKHLSKEQKEKMSEALKGENHPMYGKHHSEESNRKNSETHREYYKTHEIWNKGKPSKKFYYQTPEGEIKIMDRAHVSMHHKDWIEIGPAK